MSLSKQDQYMVDVFGFPASAFDDAAASESPASPDASGSPDASASPDTAPPAEAPPPGDTSPADSPPADAPPSGPVLPATDADLFFDVDSAELTADDSAALDKYAAAYIAAASTDSVEIDGFSSLDGDPARNNQLSNQRAQAVSTYLAGQGIPPSSLTVRALGGTDQFDAADPRANRRATLTPRSPGGTGPAPPPPPAPPVELTHRTEASSPSNRQRTTLGVGERVTLSVKPGPGAWLISGRGQLSSGRGSTVTLIAGDTAGTVDVSVNVAGQTASLRFQVIAPTTVTMEVIGTRHDPALGPNGGINTRTFIGPDNVSFANVAVLELEIAPTPANGIFSFMTGHGPNPNPIGSTATVASGKGTLSRFEDNAFIFTSTTTAPFDGTCVFNIPWQYSVNGGTQHDLTTVQQSMVSDAAGTVTITKAGASGVFPLGGTASTYAGAPY